MATALRKAAEARAAKRPPRDILDLMLVAECASPGPRRRWGAGSIANGRGILVHGWFASKRDLMACLPYLFINAPVLARWSGDQP